MALNNPFELDPTGPTSNSNFGGANQAEGCAPSNVNNAMRYLGLMLARATSYQSPAISASVSTNIAADGTGVYIPITGANAINSFGVVAGAQPGAAVIRILEFSSSASLSHGASLKLIGQASRKVQPGDISGLIHEGTSDVWREWLFSPSDGRWPLSSMTITSTDPGASVGPVLDLFRDSASPAANDVIGAFAFTGKDSGGGTDTYGRIIAAIVDQTAASEDGQFVLQTAQAGTLTNCAIFEAGMRMGGAPSGGDKGLGTINTKGLYVEGHGTVAQVVADTELTLVTSATTMPFDDTIPQNTEGVEVLSVAITPINASSTLEIEVSTQVGSSTTTTVTAALFVDTTANALNAMGESVDATTIRTIKYIHRVTAGSTSARTYKVRVGGNAGTVSLNGINGASRRYGGVCTSTLTVREILPQ